MAEKKFTLQELASLTDSTLIGNPNHVITGVNSLEFATPNQASFLANNRYEEAMKKSSAGVIFLLENAPLLENKNYLITKDPSKAFQIIVEIFLSSFTSGFIGVHKSAVLHPSVKLGKNVTVGPNTVIDENAILEDNIQIFPNCYIGSNVKIGEGSLIYSNVSIRENTIIGKRVVIQPGAVIGSCGFGFLPDEHGKYQKLNQFGCVFIEDDVEIGANTTIDRARFDRTIIKKGSKLDNLVQIAHNVEIGENNIVAAQTGISGSTKTGKNVILAGQVGIAGHLKLHDNVMVSAQSGVSKNLESGKYRGTPAIPINEWNRDYVRRKKDSEKISELEKKIEELQGQIK